MKAVVWKRYGDPSVLQVETVDPPAVGDGDILVRVRATTVTAGDIELRQFAFRNILAVPLRLYFELARCAAVGTCRPLHRYGISCTAWMTSAGRTNRGGAYSTRRCQYGIFRPS